MFRPQKGPASARMNNSENATMARPIRPLKLSERLDNVRLGTKSSHPDRVKSFPYKQMVTNMRDKAEQEDRDFQKDIFDLILLYISQGNNIDKIEKCAKSDGKKAELIALKTVYNLKNNSHFIEHSPTLSHISMAFPHVTLVLSDMMRARPEGPQPNMWVTDDDLGASIHDHFKMTYFPGLINLDGFSIKAEVGLLLYTLCHAKAIMNSSKENVVVKAFKCSCRTSSEIIEERMAPLQARKVFTKFIETIDFDAETLYNVWNSVVGDEEIPITKVTLLTHFHEQVLKAQPLNRQKWRQLMIRKDSKN